MKRSDLLYVMSLGRGGVPDASAMRNCRTLRRALANKEHSSACAGAGGDECNCSCGGSMHGGGQSGDIDTLKSTNVSALNLAPNGKTYVGFTDNSVEPPRNHYLPVGGEEDGWKVVSADYDSEEVVLEKDGKRIAVKLGGVPKEAAPKEEEPEPESGGPTPDDDGDIRSPLDYEGEGFDLGDAWEDFQESGIWSMSDNNREGILDDIRERYDQEGDEALEHGERKFLEMYGKWESVQSMAGMIVEGGGGEPPPFSETQARLNRTYDDPDSTDVDRGEAQLVYKAEMEAARRIWEAKSGQAYFTKHGRSPDSEAEALEGERLAGVPYEYEGSLADGYLKNRRRCRRRRRELDNRVDEEARGRLANTGWTDRAREVSLAVRRGLAEVRKIGAGVADGVPFRAAGGTWVKENEEVRCLRIDGVFAARSDGRYITELASGRPDALADPYALGTLNAMERYGYITPERAAAARAQYGYAQANRGSGLRSRALANVGWTDEARAAALAARRAKAAGSDNPASGGIRANGTYRNENGKKVFIPDGIPAFTPPREGTIVNAGGMISVMQNGKLVRIGSTKVLCVLPDGQLGVKRGDKAYPIGKPSDWNRRMGGTRIFKTWDGKFMIDIGKGLLSLEDGKVRAYPGRTKPDSRGTIVVQTRWSPFGQDGVPIPPDPADDSKRRDIQY